MGIVLPPGNNILVLSGCVRQNSSISDFVARGYDYDGGKAQMNSWKLMVWIDEEIDEETADSSSGNCGRLRGFLLYNISI